MRALADAENARKRGLDQQRVELHVQRVVGFRVTQLADRMHLLHHRADPFDLLAADAPRRERFLGRVKQVTVEQSGPVRVSS